MLVLTGIHSSDAGRRTPHQSTKDVWVLFSFLLLMNTVRAFPIHINTHILPTFFFTASSGEHGPILVASRVGEWNTIRGGTIFERILEMTWEDVVTPKVVFTRNDPAHPC